MSSGYTPLFGSLTTGTLCGRWPDIGLWPIVLSMSDRHGVVDVTPDYLSRVTGLPLAEVVACMERFSKPDPYSRSDSEGGARLVLLESHRDWGWKIVNHGFYREKARLAQREVERVATGANKARMASRTPADPRSPPVTTADPPSDSDSDSDSSREEQPRGKRSVATRGSRIPDPYELSEEIRQWAKSKTPDVDLAAACAEFVDYWRGVPGQKGCKLDWDATFRNRLREKQGRGPRKSNGASGWL